MVSYVFHQQQQLPGEYFVLGVDLDRYDVDNPSKYLRGLLKDDLDRKAIEAFENYVGVVGSPSGSDFDNFTQMVNDYLERPPFNFPNPLTYFGGVKRVLSTLSRSLPFAYSDAYNGQIFLSISL